LLFVPTTGPGVVSGVMEITVDQDMDNMELTTAASLVRNKFNALNVDLGITFEAYSMIMPVGVKGRGGLAHKGGNHQMYAGGGKHGYV